MVLWAYSSASSVKGPGIESPWRQKKKKTKVYTLLTVLMTPNFVPGATIPSTLLSWSGLWSCCSRPRMRWSCNRPGTLSPQWPRPWMLKNRLKFICFILGLFIRNRREPNPGSFVMKWGSVSDRWKVGFGARKWCPQCYSFLDIAQKLDLKCTNKS